MMMVMMIFMQQFHNLLKSVHGVFFLFGMVYVGVKMRTLYNVLGLTRRAPSVYAEYNIHSQQTQSLARHDDYGINTSVLYKYKTYTGK